MSISGSHVIEGFDEPIWHIQGIPSADFLSYQDIRLEGNRKELLEGLGIKHLAGKKPYQLSCGQRQRVAVARALINQPSVNFADEPTASLDHTNAQEIMNLLKNLKESTSVVIVTHDRSILENVDKTIEIWDGRIK